MASRVVFDTNVLRAGLRSRDGASFRLLELVRGRRIEPAVSVPLVLEYLAERAQRGSRAAFDRVLANVPARPPLPGDELPEAVKPNKRVQPTKGRKGVAPKRSSRSRLRS